MKACVVWSAGTARLLPAPSGEPLRMSQESRLGAAHADVVVFNKGGRDFRLERLDRGEEVPREFLYGYLDLQRAGLKTAMLSTSGSEPGWSGALANLIERVFAKITQLGVRPFSVALRRPEFGDAKVAISYTDGFSLSLGLGKRRHKQPPVLFGGFHGLSDIEARAPKHMRPLARVIIRRALAGLDHVFFFGPADRNYAAGHYGLALDRSSVIPFGVDTEFWRPLPDVSEDDRVVAIGQDHNRDYDLLAAVPGQHPTLIVTRRPVKIPAGAAHVMTSSGDYFNADSMTDEDLRRLYNSARAVIVPLKDVYQPSGYSVTLQAMSCGRPVVLSNIRGLWAPELLKDGENCLLVPPGDAAALGAAIGRLRADAGLRARLGQAARATAIAHFGLDKIGQGTLALARLGLSMAEGMHRENVA